ncbi:MAG: peptidyl-prolyl cis-trans isomerase [Eubacterium sp.]|nr:peptidyl-prolyl cis-trans isomerase [Eubacterium sp.]
MSKFMWSGKLHKRMMALILSVMVLISFSGCGESETQVTKGDTVILFMGQEIGLGEVYLYANTVIEDYEKMYGEGIWDTDVSVSSDKSLNMEDITRRDIIEDIVHVKLLCAKASEYKVDLSEAETEEAKREADDFYKNLTDQQLSDMQINYELVQLVLRENALASKVYDKIIASADIEVSDEDARETTFYDLFFEVYSVASSGDVKRLDDEEGMAQYERALQAYNTLNNPIESGGTVTGEVNIEGLAEYYGLKNSSYYTMTPDEIRETYGNDVADTIYGLEDGSYSLVTKSDFGYHIFYMKALTDRQATDTHKESILVQRKNEYMEGIYSEWLGELDPDYTYEDSVVFSTYEKIKF